MISLNKRLQTVSKYIQPGVLADIGSDHAYLPIYAVQHHLCNNAIAGEVIEGPFKAAKQNVRAHHLTQQIDVRLGDGLAVIYDNDVIDSISICGMGGPLIAKILTEGQAKLSKQTRLILQSNIQTETLRKTLVNLNFTIIAEEILIEKGHIYEIVVAKYSNEKPQYTKYELKFGPILLRNKSDIFFSKWHRELTALKHIKKQLNPTTHQERLQEVSLEVELIEEVLANEN